MFTKTNKAKRILIAALVALLLLMAGLFCVFKEDKKTVSASAATGFYFEPGMRLGTSPSNRRCLFTVYITQEMYDKLSVPTKHKEVLWGILGKSHTPNDYYLRITRSDGYYINYHIDTKYCKLASEQLDLSTGLTVYLPFPFGCDFEQEYTYECSYGVYTTQYYDKSTGEKVDANIGAVSGANCELREELDILDKASNPVTRSVAYVARKTLENDAALYDDDVIEWLKTLAGVTTSSDEFLVELKYQVIKSYGYIDYMTENYRADSRFVLASDLVFMTVMQTKGVTSITDFNVSYKDPFGQRTILQAEGHTYNYNRELGVGELTITYRSFQYKDFALRLQDNDPVDAINEYKYIYAAGDDIEYTGLTWQEGETAKLTFNYAKICTWMKASVESWLFEIDPDDITVDDSRAEHIAVTVGENELTVEFDPAYEEELKDLSITILAEIVPDHEAIVNVNYSQLIFDGNTIIDERVTDTYTIMYSDFVGLGEWGIFQQSAYYTPVEEALKVEALGDEIYFIADNVIASTITKGSEYALNVQYSYNTLFAVKDSVSGAVHFIDCTLNSLKYTIEDLKLTPPDGYRLANLVSDDSLVDVEFAEDDAENATVKLKVNSGQKLIIPITATFSDKWYLDIVYLKPYKNTPFAVKTTETFEVGVDDYEDIENMKKADILALLGRDSMVVANIADADAISSAKLTSSSTYTCTVTYGVASWKQTDYEGKSNELQIPLTSYADWCDSFGEDWTIMYLNRYDRERYFEYTNDVPREDLYGFFSVAVFQEKVSNLNYYFANSGGDGSAIIFEDAEVKGSKLYQFFGTLKGNILTSPIGHVGMMLCEAFDKDNGVYQSVHFYLDGTTKQGGIDRNNGGDSDSAFENAMENFFDKMGEFFDDFGNGLKKFWKKILKYGGIVILGVVGGGIVIGVGVNLGKKFYRWATTDKPKPQATEQPKKQPAKKKKKKRSGSNKRKNKK